jgi:fused signal recognition particle receptor
LAKNLKEQGKKVILAAGDTFRAAGIEQLVIWAKKAGVDVVKGEPGSDPSAVIFDCIKAAVFRNMDIVIADTAGRQHTKTDLMNELNKVKRAMGKALSGSPHETLLVLDAGTGQNAVSQAREFHSILGLTGLIMTKLDGTAKGGTIVPIVRELSLPVYYLGFGEGIDDLLEFRASDYVEALF